MTLREVHALPGQGAFTQPWDADPAVDLFCRSARRVTACLGQFLHELPLPVGLDALTLTVEPTAVTDVQVNLRRSGPMVHQGVVRVPGEFAQLPAGQRADVVLTCFEAALLLVAERAEVNRLAVSRVVDAAREAGAQLRWRSPFTERPDGRQFGMRATIADDGFARISVELVGRNGVMLHSPLLVGWTSVASIVRAQRSLRSEDMTVLVEPCVDSFERSTGVVAVEPEHLRPEASVEELDALVAPLEQADLAVRAGWTDEPEDVMAVYGATMAAGLEAGNRDLDVPVGFTD